MKPVSRPFRSQYTSGLSVTLQRLLNTQCRGNCAAIHKARGSPGLATSSVPIWYSNAVVKRSAFHSAMLSERYLQNSRVVLDWWGPIRTVCFTVVWDVAL